MHESSEDFEIRRDPTNDCPLASYNGEKRCCYFFSAVFDRILFILAGNDDIHKSLDEFEIRPGPSTDHRVTCP